jgi:hypothetical protein
MTIERNFVTLYLKNSGPPLLRVNIFWMPGPIFAKASLGRLVGDNILKEKNFLPEW